MYIDDTDNSFDYILNRRIEDYTKWIKYIEDRHFNDAIYFISNEKLKNLDWNIKVNFIEGIKKIL